MKPKVRVSPSALRVDPGVMDAFDMSAFHTASGASAGYAISPLIRDMVNSQESI
ncbi:MAG TPA: hypothetical protein VGU71_13320 [Candidatus Dormibacteraeota bacterium]|nr:hypothetical protein [Candidatus Dormibacteraeota bacterium]